jgi:hypothetical protein
MNSLYLSIRDGLVANAIQQFGMPMTLSTETAGVYDPATGVISNPTKVESPVSGLIMEYDSKDIDGSVIKIGDKKVLMTASDTTPEPTSDYTLTMGDKDWAVINCNPIAPAGLAIVYEVQVRK